MDVAAGTESTVIIAADDEGTVRSPASTRFSCLARYAFFGSSASARLSSASASARSPRWNWTSASVSR